MIGIFSAILVLFLALISGTEFYINYLFWVPKNTEIVALVLITVIQIWEKIPERWKNKLTYLWKRYIEKKSFKMIFHFTVSGFSQKIKNSSGRDELEKILRASGNQNISRDMTGKKLLIENKYDLIDDTDEERKAEDDTYVSVRLSIETKIPVTMQEIEKELDYIDLKLVAPIVNFLEIEEKGMSVELISVDSHYTPDRTVSKLLLDRNKENVIQLNSNVTIRMEQGKEELKITEQELSEINKNIKKYLELTFI